MRSAVRAIHHRGPDQSGTFDTHTVSLGAVRLKIIDLHGGEQPMRSHDGDAIIVFNGEVYNHAEIRSELENLGVRFRSRCDTEVVLEAWLRWGRESFQQTSRNVRFCYLAGPRSPAGAVQKLARH